MTVEPDKVSVMDSKVYIGMKLTDWLKIARLLREGQFFITEEEIEGYNKAASNLFSQIVTYHDRIEKTNSRTTR